MVNLQQQHGKGAFRKHKLEILTKTQLSPPSPLCVCVLSAIRQDHVTLWQNNSDITNKLLVKPKLKFISNLAAVEVEVVLKT